MRMRRPVAVVSETFVQRYLRAGNVLGTTFRAPRLSEPPFSMPSDVFEIVGVVADTTGAFTREVRPEAYIPFTVAGGPPNFAVVIRSKTGDAMTVISALRAAVAAADKDQPIMDAEPVDRFIARFVSAGPRFNVVLFGVFGALGLALVTVGIYGVIASAVARRTREIGVRMALGATVSDVVRLVVGRGARLVAVGILVGLVGAFAVARYLETMLRGGSPYDPLSMRERRRYIGVYGRCCQLGTSSSCCKDPASQRPAGGMTQGSAPDVDAEHARKVQPVVGFRAVRHSDVRGSSICDCPHKKHLAPRNKSRWIP